MQPWAELSLSLAGVERTTWDSPRAAIEWVAARGFRAIQLDASMPGLRPRELDGSSRRGIISLLRRLELRFSGLDLWIPPEHFSRPDTQQRAFDAAEAAMLFTADLRTVGPSATVCIRLPKEPGPCRDHLAATASRHGVTIADFNATEAVGEPIVVGIGIDPAVSLLRGEDPAGRVSTAGASLACARLSDADGSRRVAVGSGKLDAMAYGIALATAGYSRPVVLDISDVDSPDSAAGAGKEAWPPV